MVENILKRGIVKTKLRSKLHEIVIVALVFIIIILFLVTRSNISSDVYGYIFAIALVSIGVLAYPFLKQQREEAVDVEQLINRTEQLYEQYNGTASFSPHIEDIEAIEHPDKTISLYDVRSDHLLTFRGKKLIGKLNQDLKTRDRELFERRKKLGKPLEEEAKTIARAEIVEDLMEDLK